MKVRIFIVCSLSVFFTLQVHSQKIYTVDISKSAVPVISGHLKFGSNKNPSGDSLSANSLYFIKNGTPWYPVMGEIHFSRFPREKWEEAILHMKAAGIDIIASYVFWIYHEEEEGKFNWSGNNDLREFARLCQKNKVYFFIRIGPWCHGEVRNGGFPDWIVKRGNTRKNNTEYLQSVRKFYEQVGEQLKSYYFKDGGPVIGVQIENEYRFNNPAGLEHMLSLKKMAVDAGIDVPYYTATGWPGSNQKQDELIPVWGAYPEAPWDKRTTELSLSENYLFSALRNDPSIGSDLIAQQDAQTNFKGYRYPYATAEMGAGNQITYHRRPFIASDDVTALTYVKVGAGANLMGYYMFHGGSNPIGKFSTLQESKATKYPNDYPIISYDFQSPIGEWGQLRDSYFGYKTIHTFLNEFGDRLSACFPTLPDQKPTSPSNDSLLRFAVRSSNNSGFIFISNYQRQLRMKDQENVKFQIKFKEGNLLFPMNTMRIKSGLQAIMPFNMGLNGINLKYATAQPFCLIGGEVPMYVFFSPEGINSEFAIDKKFIKTLKTSNAKIIDKYGSYLITQMKPGTSCITDIFLVNGNRMKILTLSASQISHTWKTAIGGKDYLFISSEALTFSNNQLTLQAEAPQFTFSVYPSSTNFLSPYKFSKKPDGVFTSYNTSLPGKKIGVTVKEVTDISPYMNKGIQVPADNRDSTNSVQSNPGPQYQTNLTHVQGSHYFEISIPGTLDGLNEAFLRINYTGDTGAFYVDGILVADDFFSGVSTTIELKRFATKQGIKMLFQVVPLSADRKIYFPEGVRDHLGKSNTGGVQSAVVIPKYGIKLNLLTHERDTSFTNYSAFVSAKKEFPDINILMVKDNLPPSVKSKMNITYRIADGKALQLDVFYPKKHTKSLPAILIIHGGGWRSGSRSQHYAMAERLAEKGFVCFTASYRLSTEALYPAAVEDLKLAIGWIKNNAQQFGADKNKVVSLGFSAGGQLAALLGTTTSVQAIVDIDGILAFIHAESGEGNDTKSISAATNWFGYTKLEKPTLWEEASALTYAGKTTPPTLFINSSRARMHAGRDDYIKILSSYHIYTEVHEFNAPHPFCLFEPWFTPTIDYIVTFLNKVL